jgi:hypothetical protein
VVFEQFLQPSNSPALAAKSAEEPSRSTAKTARKSGLILKGKIGVKKVPLNGVHAPFQPCYSTS